MGATRRRRGEVAPFAGNGFRVMLYTIDIALVGLEGSWGGVCVRASAASFFD